MNKLIRVVNPKRIESVAGAGNKFTHIAEKLSDFYINLVPGFKYWDMCASEAIVNSVLGVVTDAD